MVRHSYGETFSKFNVCGSVSLFDSHVSNPSSFISKGNVTCVICLLNKCMIYNWKGNERIFCEELVLLYVFHI